MKRDEYKSIQMEIKIPIENIEPCPAHKRMQSESGERDLLHNGVRHQLAKQRQSHP